MNELSPVKVVTDGACKGNPGPGGWGVLIRAGTREKELAGGEKHTTNNRMELTAAIRGLEALTRPCHVTLVTDSVYVKDGIVWRTARHRIDWVWVKGHAGDEDNERADRLASDAALIAQSSGA